MESVQIRRKVLVSAYACGPGMGSEPGAGWALVEAAAASCEVWVVTRHRFAQVITDRLAAEPKLANAIHPIYLDLAPAQLALKRHHRDVYWYYPLWQRRLSAVAREFHRTINFDVVHHLTFATDWMPCGLRALASEVPLVWGPVGGSTYVPVGMLRWLGWRGAAHEVARAWVTRGLRRLIADSVARQAALVVALNADVQERFSRHGDVVIEQNAVIEPLQRPEGTSKSNSSPRVNHTAVFVGRLVAWKGVRLALAALAQPEAAAWNLEFVGSGPERPWIERQILRLGLGGRVVLHGQLSRAEVNSVMERADAMLFPSLHDSAPWAVAEATAAGVPVVCVNIGGPPEIAGAYGYVVEPTASAPRDLAVGLRQLEGKPRPRPDTRWSAARLPALVEGWYNHAVGSPSPNLQLRQSARFGATP